MEMAKHLLHTNQIIDYGILIGSVLILGYSLYYLSTNNYTAIPSTNVEGLTNEEIENILNENMQPVLNGNIDNIITESDFDTDSEYLTQSTLDNDSAWDSDSSSDSENILNPDIFYMPDVDFNVCPIQELKLFEFNSLYAKEIEEHGLDDEEIMEFLAMFSDDQLATNWINELFELALSLL